MVVAQQPAESLPAHDAAFAYLKPGSGLDQGTLKALVISLLVVMREVFTDRVAEVAFAKDHHAS